MPGRHIQNPGSSIQEEVKERGVRKFLALKKNSVPDMGGKCCEKNRDAPTSALEKNRVHEKWGLKFFSQHFPPCLGLCFFSELKFSDSSLRHFLLYAGARVLDMASWHPMALKSAPDQTFFCQKYPKKAPEKLPNSGEI